MPVNIEITTITANTPFDVYVCDALSGSCTYVSTVANAPYVFEVDDTYATENFIIKVVDVAGCIVYHTVAITPTPTPTPTPTASANPVIKKVTITCIKGKTSKKVTAVKPKCPTGYKKK